MVPLLQPCCSKIVMKECGQMRCYLYGDFSQNELFLAILGQVPGCRSQKSGKKCHLSTTDTM